MKLDHQVVRYQSFSRIKMSNDKYKMLVEKLTSEIFNVHTSMAVANEEIQKLSASNSKLIERNEHLELSLVNTEALKQKVEYLKNKILCAEKIGKVPRDKLAENALKIRSLSKFRYTCECLS